VGVIDRYMLEQKVDEVLFFIAVNFWYIFLAFAILFFFLSIKLFKDKARLWGRFRRFNAFFKELATRKKEGEIEQFLIDNKDIFGADAVALYIRRGDIFILQASSEGGVVDFKNRIYRRDVIEEIKEANRYRYMVESEDGQALLALYAKREIDIEEVRGFIQSVLAYYLKAAQAWKEHTISNLSTASKEMLSSVMRMQYGTETFLKFVISLLLKIDGVTGVMLINKNQPKKAKVFRYPEKGEYKKRFFIRNTPYILDIFSTKPLEREEIVRIGSFLDLAGSYFENASENSRLIHNYINFLRLSNEALELQSPYFKNHAKKVRIAAVETAKALFLDERSIDTVALGAELHDIGMVGKIESFLDSRRIDKNELDLIRYHPIVGSILVEPISHVYNIAPLVKFHHERFDGTGYPYGLKGKDIPVLAQIVALAEYFVGITSPRAYRRALEFGEAIVELKKQRNRLVDGGIIDAFLEVADGIKKKIELLDAK